MLFMVMGLKPFSLKQIVSLMLLVMLALFHQASFAQAPAGYNDPSVYTTPGSSTDDDPTYSAPTDESASDASCANNCFNQCGGNTADIGFVGCVNTCKAKCSSTPAAASACPGYAEAKQKCMDDEASASNSCDENSNPALSAISSMAQSLGSSTATSEVASCSKMASVIEGADAALAAYRLNCASSASSCSSSCQAAQAALNSNAACQATGEQTSINQLLAQCSTQSNKAQSAQSAIANYAMTLNNASGCATQTSLTDCSNPAMASNTICLCAANPTSPTCTTAAVATNSAANYPDSSSRMNSSAVDPGADQDPVIPGTPTAGSTDPSLDGKQGSGVQLGGDSGTGKSSAPPGAAGAVAGGPPGVNSGFYGSGGGGGFFGSGSSGGTAAAVAAGLSKLAKGIDLKSFLPGGKLDPKRGIAGASGPDGITGPNSDIWQKIQNRYSNMAPTLLP